MAFSFDRFYRLNRKTVIWIILFGLIYLLRDLFGLIFLIFIIGFFTHPAIRYLNDRLRINRYVATTIVYSSILVAFVMMVAWISPSIVGQVNGLRRKLPEFEEDLKRLHAQFMDPAQYPELAARYDDPNDEYTDFWVRYPNLAQLLATFLPPEDLDRDLDSLKARMGLPWGDPPGPDDLVGPPAPVIASPPLLDAPAASDLETRIARLETRNAELLEMMTELRNQEAAAAPVARVEQVLPRVITQLPIQLLSFGTNALLAILFSYMISLSYFRLREQVKSIKASRLRDFYEEAGEPVVNFALAVGRGFQALVIISLLTVLIMLPGLIVFKLPSLHMLVSIVFVTSLIPVVGVFFEVIPIMLVTLNGFGLERAFAVLVWIMFVHLLVGYVIGPIIFGRRFRMNLVLVLFTLFFAERFFGVWGLILGVPVTSYVIREVLRIPLEWKEEAEEPTRAVELKTDDESAPLGIKKPQAQKGGTLAASTLEE